MPIIKLMDTRLADMIAAGEVVDRPASIIKELVENAIDAKATSIQIEVFEYGMKKIIVTDNGVGMDQMDAQMAFKRHATSKIAHEKDLSQIKTLGFRGEALAAIASVSKIALKTRQENQDGYQIILHGGIIQKEGVAACNVGTTMTVSDLFYNTPARFKYIKSDIAEKNQIIDIFDRLALSNPKVRMQLWIDQKLIKETYGTNDIPQVINQIYGVKTTTNMVTFHENISKISISGYLLSPSFSRSKKKDISIFINGRYVKNYPLIQAVVDGYHGYLMIGKFPIALIYIELDTSLIDVNVHPQKTEVKLSNEMLLAFQIEQHIIKHLNQTKHQIISHTFDQIDLKSYTKIAFDLNDIKLEEEKDKSIQMSQKLPMMEYLASLGGTYLLFQSEEGLILIDQHAAEERIRYEHYYEVLGTPTKVSKHLILSRPIDMVKSDVSHLENHINDFKNLGFEFNQNFEITMIPSWLNEDDIDDAIISFLSMLEDKKHIDLSLYRDDLAKSIACKKSIKANQMISRHEVNHLIKRLNEAENPYFCPHGRPTIIKVTYHEIEKMFKRTL